MGYDKELDDRLQRLVADWNLERRTMFGGTGYLTGGNMVCGVNQDVVILRVDKSTGEELLGMPNVSPFGMSGRAMGGWLEVPGGSVDDATLRSYLERCYAYAFGLPPKTGNRKKM